MRHPLPRVIVLTGASRGIGAALAFIYAAPGACLALQGRNAQRLSVVAEKCRARGAEVFECLLDVRDAASLRTWLEDFDAAHPVDLLVANAGVASVLVSLDQWEAAHTTAQVMDINWTGTLNTVEPIAQRMRLRGKGHIAVVSSLSAFRGMAISPAYCASKAALKAWGQAVRPLLANQGVALTMIFPGFVRSDMSDAFPGRKPFLLDAPHAAGIIQRALNARRASLVFPILLGLGTQLLNLLPDPWADQVLTWLALSPKRT